MAIKDVATGRSDLYRLDPSLIQVKPDWNSRDAADPANRTHIEELKLSIKEIGVKKPLVGFMENNIVYVTDGHCRLAAVMELISEGVEIKTVPFLTEDKFSNEADRIFSQIVHNAGKPLTVIEQGKVFKRLIDLGWKGIEIAAKAGISGSRVSQILDLQTLPIVLQRFIVEGRASAAMVLATFKKHNEDTALTIAELTGAVAKAESEGRKRAMPKDVGEGDGEPVKKPKEGTNKVKAMMRALIEKAYADGRIDDTEAMVTLSVDESDWAELMEAIDY